MKLVNVEESNRGHGYKVAMIALNINELALLRGMASELGETLPKRGPTARLRAVARQMAKEMGDSIEQLENSGSKQARLLYPGNQKSVL